MTQGQVYHFDEQDAMDYVELAIGQETEKMKQKRSFTRVENHELTFMAIWHSLSLPDILAELEFSPADGEYFLKGD